MDRLGVDDPLKQAGVEVAAWSDLEDFRVAARDDVGLSTAEWAIAETGSLVLASGPGRGRTVTLLPPTYVAVVAVEKVLSTGPEAIENSLVAGIHGPGDVHVVLVG